MAKAKSGRFANLTVMDGTGNVIGDTLTKDRFDFQSNILTASGDRALTTMRDPADNTLYVRFSPNVGQGTSPQLIQANQIGPLVDFLQSYIDCKGDFVRSAADIARATICQDGDLVRFRIYDGGQGSKGISVRGLDGPGSMSELIGAIRDLTVNR